MKGKEKRRYTVVIVMADNTFKSVFTGYFMECADVAIYLIDKYNIRRSKIVFINDSTYEIVNPKSLMGGYPYKDFGSLDRGKKLIPPWERKEW